VGELAAGHGAGSSAPDGTERRDSQVAGSASVQVTTWIGSRRGIAALSHQAADGSVDHGPSSIGGFNKADWRLQEVSSGFFPSSGRKLHTKRCGRSRAGARWPAPHDHSWWIAPDPGQLGGAASPLSHGCSWASVDLGADAPSLTIPPPLQGLGDPAGLSPQSTLGATTSEERRGLAAVGRLPRK
jgi:hypothetical protein